MRNILKGFLEPKADSYILPSADDLTFEEGIKDFALPSLDEEEPVPEEPAASPEEELSITVGDEASEAAFQEPEPVQEEQPKEPETPVHYAQLQAELILNQAREEARQLLDQARTQAIAEQEEIRAGARDEGYREGYAQSTAKAMDDAIRDREATAARLEKDVQAFL